MERERSGKVIAIATLIVGIIGLSLGFAAFSTSLNITSSADVPIDASVWNVGFSTEDDAMTPGNVTGSGSNGTLALTQFVISQGTNAVLNTTNNSSVEYDFYIYNGGDLDAYLNTVTMGNLTCAYNGSATPRVTDSGHTSITAGTGTITPANCQALFEATLTLDVGDANAVTKTNGDASQSSGFGTHADVPAKTGIPAKLTISYINDSLHTLGADAPNGDFVVSLSDTVVVYGSTSN